MIDQPTIQQVASGSDEVVMTADFPRLSTQALFDYFTVPDLLARWWPPEATIEGRPGGSYHLYWPAMNWELYGEYSQFEPGQCLAFSWQWRHEPDLPTRQVSIQIEATAQGSQNHLRHSSYDQSERDQADRQSHIDGWYYFLAKLQEQVP